MKQDLPEILLQDHARKRAISFKQKIFWICFFLLPLHLALMSLLALADSRESLRYPSPPIQKKPSTSYSIENLWVKKLHSRLASAPVIAQDQVLVLFASGKIKSFALGGGHLQWECGPFPEGILLGKSEHSVILKSGFDLIALNVTNGEVLWTTPLPSSFLESSPLDSNSIAILTDHMLFKLNVSDGSILKITPIHLPLKTPSPFTFDGERYLAIIQNSRSLLVYDTKRNKIKWSFQSGTKITQPPILEDKVLYILSEDHFIYALKLKNGHQNYRKKMENKLKYPAARSEQSLILSPFASKHLYLVEMSSGASQTLFTLDSERYHFVNRPSFTEKYLAATYADFFSEASFLIVFSVEKDQEEERGRRGIS